MEYKLAKQLKDAGFPYKDSELCYYVDEKNNPCQFNLPTATQIPTLDELIDACGDGLGLLTHEDFGDGVHWEALSSEHNCRGKTPTEAVAKLYLKLNE